MSVGRSNKYNNPNLTLVLSQLNNTTNPLTTDPDRKTILRGKGAQQGDELARVMQVIAEVIKDLDPLEQRVKQYPLNKIGDNFRERVAALQSARTNRSSRYFTYEGGVDKTLQEGLNNLITEIAKKQEGLNKLITEIAKKVQQKQ